MHTQITSAIVEDTQAPESGSLLIRDTKLIGFGLRISPLGTRTFIVEGKLRGTRTTRRLSLGRYPVVTLGRARDKARETLYQLYLGIDPR
ncbi:MAG: Arm DNA-binding domain-containing protein, partial [Pseudomonadota bacterium]|nr:Arm DNA-binding domain-containing protein [Pseudomonadota bacterium]